jgi:hypothetical protein
MALERINLRAKADKNTGTATPAVMAVVFVNKMEVLM